MRAAARGAAAAAQTTVERSTPSAPAPADRPASETPDQLDGALLALADPTVLEAVAAVPVNPPARTPAPTSDLPDDRFLNRELSWLDFNARVLALAEDRGQPLLERVKFLAIFASNLDEFYMVRVAGLKRRADMGLQVTPRRRAVAARAAGRARRRAPRELVERHARCFRDDVQPGAGRARASASVRWDDLDDEEQRPAGASTSAAKVFPVLTPLAVDPAHPFPYISGLSLNLAVLVRDPDGGAERFARVKVPNNVPRFVRRVADAPAEAEFLPLEDLIAAHLPMLFPGMEVVEHHAVPGHPQRRLRGRGGPRRGPAAGARARAGPAPVRAGRAARGRRRHRRRGRSSCWSASSTSSRDDVLRVPGLLDLAALWQLYDVDRPDAEGRAVRARPPTRASPRARRPKSVFATLREGDVLVHHPYDSFATSVQRFIEQAAADPNVLAIKQTLYRTSGDSPIVDALIDAAEAGKQVVALVEIKARFDEQANIKWARALERAGCHVVYGARRAQDALQDRAGGAPGGRPDPPLLPTSAPATTTRRPPGSTRTSGCSPPTRTIGADLTDLFNVLTGYSPPDRVPLAAGRAAAACAPGSIERIEREIEHARAGRAGAHPAQDQPPRRRADRSTRSTGPRGPACRSTCLVRDDLRDPARRARAVGEHHASARSSAASSSTRRIFYFGSGGEPSTGSAAPT